MLSLLSLLAGAAMAQSWPSIEAPRVQGGDAPADAAVLLDLAPPPGAPGGAWTRHDMDAFYGLLIHTRGVNPGRIWRLDGGALEAAHDAVRTAAAQASRGGVLWVYVTGQGGIDYPALEALTAGGRGQLLLVTDALPERPLLGAVQHGAVTYFTVGALRGWADGALDGVPDGRVTAEETRRFVRDRLVEEGLTVADPIRGDAEILVSAAGLEPAPERWRAAAAPEPAAAGAGDCERRLWTLDDLEPAQSPEHRAMARKKRLESIAFLKQLLARQGVDSAQRAEMMLRLAHLYFEQGRSLRLDGDPGAGAWNDKAIDLFRQLLSDHPGFPRADEASFYLALATGDAGGDPSPGLRALIETWPSSRYVTDAWLRLGERAFDGAELYKATRAFMRAAPDATHPRHGYALYRLAWCRWLLGEPAAARETASAAVIWLTEVGNSPDFLAEARDSAACLE